MWYIAFFVLDGIPHVNIQFRILVNYVTCKRSQSGGRGQGTTITTSTTTTTTTTAATNDVTSLISCLSQSLREEKWCQSQTLLIFKHLILDYPLTAFGPWADLAMPLKALVINWMNIKASHMAYIITSVSLCLRYYIWYCYTWIYIKMILVYPCSTWVGSYVSMRWWPGSNLVILPWP